MPARPTTNSAPTKGIAHDVYGQIRDMIVRSALAPGAPLIERQLAARLEVSRGSLRSALQRLEHEGFIRSTSSGKYSRAIVAPLTIAEMEEIYTLAGALDGVAARQAALLPAARREAIADAMAAVNAEFAGIYRSPGDRPAIYEVDRRFHACYVEEAGGPRTVALYEAITAQGERYGRAYATALVAATGGPDRLSTAPAEHRAIVDAIRAGDAEAAERAAVTNWRNAAERFRRVISAAGERGSF